MIQTERPDLILKDIQDRWIRENFFRIDKFFRQFPFFKGNWVFFEFSFESAVTAKRLPHGLRFRPKDVIQTSLVGPGALTWLYADFDSENLVVTTSGACTVRAFVGAYEEN